MLLAIIIGNSLLSCSLFYTTISVEVPSDHAGWCYIIPIKDISGITILKDQGMYKMDDNGVVYVPEDILDLKKGNQVKLYENGKDISKYMHYAGTVQKISANGKEYRYLGFYLPKQKERTITDGQYWRDKMYEYSLLDKFDSLVSHSKIIFK